MTDRNKNQFWMGACCSRTRESCLLSLLKTVITCPPTSFDHMSVPIAPDYSDPSSWAAFPSTASAACIVPSDVADASSSDILKPISAPAKVHYEPLNDNDLKADVFFVHPTGYFGADWNAPIGHPATCEKIVCHLALQASAFNESCKIYAPHYREATLGAFLYSREDGIKALNLAYSDVERAFRYYLEHYNQGRPFFLASHSQVESKSTFSPPHHAPLQFAAPTLTLSLLQNTRVVGTCPGYWSKYWTRIQPTCPTSCAVIS